MRPRFIHATAIAVVALFARTAVAQSDPRFEALVTLTRAKVTTRARVHQWCKRTNLCQVEIAPALVFVSSRTRSRACLHVAR